MKIGIACDHAGYEYKTKLINFLEKLGHDVKDYGCHSEESMDYPDTAHPLAAAVNNNEYNFGITICGSGNGITMTANKYQGVRAALCWTAEISELARQHNDANICGIPARFISYELAQEIVKTFMNTEFEGGRHQKRVDKISVK